MSENSQKLFMTVQKLPEFNTSHPPSPNPIKMNIALNISETSATARINLLQKSLALIIAGKPILPYLMLFFTISTLDKIPI